MLLVKRGTWEFTGRPISARCSRPFSRQASFTSTPDPLLRHRLLSTTNKLLGKRRRDFFSSNTTLRRPQTEVKDGRPQQTEVEDRKRKVKRTPPGKNSLRSVAVEAQRSRAGNELKKSASPGLESETKVP